MATQRPKRKSRGAEVLGEFTELNRLLQLPPVTEHGPFADAVGPPVVEFYRKLERLRTETLDCCFSRIRTQIREFASWTGLRKADFVVLGLRKLIADEKAARTKGSSTSADTVDGSEIPTEKDLADARGQGDSV